MQPPPPPPSAPGAPGSRSSLPYHPRGQQLAGIWEDTRGADAQAKEPGHKVSTFQACLPQGVQLSDVGLPRPLWKSPELPPPWGFWGRGWAMPVLAGLCWGGLEQCRDGGPQQCRGGGGAPAWGTPVPGSVPGVDRPAVCCSGAGW